VLISAVFLFFYFTSFLALPIHIFTIFSETSSFAAKSAADAFAKSSTLFIPFAFSWSALFSFMPLIFVSSVPCAETAVSSAGTVVPVLSQVRLVLQLCVSQLRAFPSKEFQFSRRWQLAPPRWLPVV
jgi:hypothetical protein